MLTKKHFNELANIFARHQPDDWYTPSGDKVHKSLMLEIMSFCKKSNPAFDKDRFMCRVTELVNARRNPE